MKRKKMKWKLPPKIKIWEALGAVADGRVEVSGSTAKVFSSSGNKFYSVAYSPEENAITANDNGSYWVGYLGYPSIAYLLKAGVIDFEPKTAAVLKRIPWKDLNAKFRNDFEKTEGAIREKLEKKGVDVGELEREVERVYKELKRLNLNKLGKTQKPPAGY